MVTAFIAFQGDQASSRLSMLDLRVGTSKKDLGHQIQHRNSSKPI